MRKKPTIIAMLWALGLVSSGAAVSHAAQCLTGPVALPSLSGAPVWFDPGSGGDWRATLHDPRWAGSELRPYAATVAVPLGADASLAFGPRLRLLTYGGKLYVAYHATSDANGPSAGDAVYLGLSDAAGTTAFAIHVALHAASPAGEPSTPQDTVLPKHNVGPTINVYEWTGGAWSPSPLSPDPSWLSSVASWTGSPGVDWAVSFVVDPPAAGITGALKMFWGTRINVIAPAGATPASDVLYGNVVPATASDPSVNSTIIPSDISGWEDVDTLGTACSDGISVQREDIGVIRGGTLTNVICKDGTTSGCTGADGTNTFQVTATGISDPPPPPYSIRARIRIADWGATLPSRKFAPWKDIPGIVPAGQDGSALFDLPTSHFMASGSGWSWSTSAVPGGHTATLEYTCTTEPGKSYCPAISDATATHQCILVELGQRTTGTRKFIQPAVYRNMNFQGLSSVERKAKIDVRGLQKLLGDDRPRDLYLHLSRKNMPKPSKRAMRLDSKVLAKARWIAENPLAIPHRKPNPEEVAAARREKRPVQLALEPKLAAQLVSNKPLLGKVAAADAWLMAPERLLSEVYPTYEVRVYYDTGNKTVHGSADGKATSARVLLPFVPFGYHLTHEGDFYGFASDLLGVDGANLEPLGDDWYKLVVPNESAATVLTKATAEEKAPSSEASEDAGVGAGPGPSPRPPQPTCMKRCGCRTAGNGSAYGGPLLFGLGLIGLALRRRRRAARRAPEPLQ